MRHGKFTRRDAIEELRNHGIAGKAVYFIATIPLIEMMWADGKVQPTEWTLLEKFLTKHVSDLNRLAGMVFVTYEDGLAFVNPFLRTRPSDGLLRVLTSLVPLLDLHSSNRRLNEERREAILDFCLDIAAAAVTEYPYGDHERFNAAEKACFKEVARVLERPLTERAATPRVSCKCPR